MCNARYELNAAAACYAAVRYVCNAVLRLCFMCVAHSCHEFAVPAYRVENPALAIELDETKERIRHRAQFSLLLSNPLVEDVLHERITKIPPIFSGIISI